MLEFDRLKQENEDLRKRRDFWRRNYEYVSADLAKARSVSRFWEGKFHQVKRENNALRKQLWQRRVKAKEEVSA